MKSTLRITTALLTLSVVLCVCATPASAVRTKLETWNDDGNCDPLSLPFFVDELGRAFPDDELINTDTSTTTDQACDKDNPDIANEKVLIINQTNRSFTDLWYVADPETTLSNFDGVVNGEFAFQIDSRGVNKPLVSESITVDEIFEPGESWEFIIDDYTNSLGVGAWEISSIGVPSPDQRSSGSVIAVPEPSSLILMTLGLMAVLRRRHSR